MKNKLASAVWAVGFLLSNGIHQISLALAGKDPEQSKLQAIGYVTVWIVGILIFWPEKEKD